MKTSPALLAFAVTISGCATSVHYFSKTPDLSRSGKLTFRAPVGSNVTIFAFENAADCSGSQYVTSGL